MGEAEGGRGSLRLRNDGTAARWRSSAIYEWTEPRRLACNGAAHISADRLPLPDYSRGRDRRQH